MAELHYPAKLHDVDLHPAWLEFQFFERKSAADSAIDDVIQLYMPEMASQPSTVSWDTEKFGFVGASIAGNGSGSTFSDGASLAYQRAISNIQAGMASRMGGRVSAEGLMGETQGKIPNPYLTMVFRGIDFRNFQYVFKFFPFSEGDCDTIHEIIKTFRKNSLTPSGGKDPFLGYPKEVQVAYKWKGEDNKYLNKFKRAVITGVDINYTPNGMFSTMRNGFPSCIEMTLKLSEIEIVTRDDVEEGF